MRTVPQSADASRATSPMTAASSFGRDHMGQWLVGRSAEVTVRHLGRAADQSPPLAHCGFDLVGGNRRANDDAWHVEPAVIRQLGTLTQDRRRLGHRPLPEGLELVGAQTVEVLIEFPPRGERFLDSVDVRVERARPRAGVDIDHRREFLWHAVARAVAGDTGATVHGKHDGSPRGHHRLADRVNVVGQRDRGTVGIHRLETGQRDRGDVTPVGAEGGDDVLPRPLSEPEPRNEDDRYGSHAPTLRARTDTRGGSAAGCSPDARGRPPPWHPPMWTEVGDSLRQPEVSLSADPLYRLVVTLNQSWAISFTGLKRGRVPCKVIRKARAWPNSPWRSGG